MIIISIIKLLFKQQRPIYDWYMSDKKKHRSFSITASYSRHACSLNVIQTSTNALIHSTHQNI